MYNNPVFFKGSPEIMLLIIPAAFLFCWLFNSCRLGKLKRSKQSARDRKRNDRMALFILFLFIIATTVAAAVLESFLYRFLPL